MGISRPVMENSILFPNVDGFPYLHIYRQGCEGTIKIIQSDLCFVREHNSDRIASVFVGLMR